MPMILQLVCNRCGEHSIEMVAEISEFHIKQDIVAIAATRPQVTMPMPNTDAWKVLAGELVLCGPCYEIDPNYG